MATDNWLELPVTTGGGGSGVTSLNGLSGALVLVTGTTGTDFNISSVGSVISLNLPIASAVNTGKLSNTDWITFNSKQSALTFGSISSSTATLVVTNGANSTVGPNVVLSLTGGNLTDVGTDGIVITNGTGAVIGTGTSIAQHVADSTHNGYLSSTDWVTFNSKQASGNYITALTGDVVATGPGSVTATISVGAVTDTKASLSNKPAVTVVATTNQALTGTPTIDGQATAAGSVILLTAQTTGSQNGPWVAAAGAWSRPTWYPSGGTTQAFQFITTIIRLGATYQGTTWRMTTAGPITIDTTATTWVVTPLAINSSTVTGALPIANGGTAATTAPAARVNLNIDERTTFSNANVTVVSTDRYVAQIGTMSAPRTVTLPAANSVNPGQSLIIIDESGTVSTTNTLTITRAGADLINGATTGLIRTAYGRAILYSDGVSNWTDAVTGVSRGGTGLTTLPTNGQLLIGNTTTSAYSLSTLTAGPGITITNGAGTIQINNSSIPTGTLSPGVVGDGVDGDVTISVNTTLTRDMDYNSLVVNAGVTLTTAGFIISSKTSITVNATGLIVRNGNPGGNAATTAAGAAGAALAAATTGASGAGAAGGAGTTGNGGSGASSAGVAGEGGTGGVGGNGGGGNGGATVGGSGGNSGVLTIHYFRNVQTMWKYTAVGTFMPTGVGGAGGAAGGGDGTNSGRGGGGGGSAGGGILIICDTLVNNGTIQAKGGVGGNGGGTPTANTGGGAGGGGGGGGKIMILCNTLTTRGTLDVNGGAGGTGSAGGGTGVAGTNGAAGNPGYATTFEAGTGTWTTTS